MERVPPTADSFNGAWQPQVQVARRGGDSAACAPHAAAHRTRGGGGGLPRRAAAGRAGPAPPTGTGTPATGPPPPPRGPALSPQGQALLPQGPAPTAALAMGRHGCSVPLCASGAPRRAKAVTPPPEAVGLPRLPDVLEAAVGAWASSPQWCEGIIPVSPWPGSPARCGLWLPQT